jgi:hypothetical protein
VEVGGSKSVVFCGASTHKVCTCFDYCLPFHGNVKNPSIRGFESGHFLFAGSEPVALGLSKHWSRTLADQFPGRWLLGLGCEDRYAGDGAGACGHCSGVWRKSHPSHKWRVSAETTRCSKCDHLLHDGSVRLDIMTDDVHEAEEMRIQTVADTLETFSTTFVVSSVRL